MDTSSMSDRHNRTIYISDLLMETANTLGKKKDRSASRIIEYALIEYFRKNGIEISESPDDTE